MLRTEIVASKAFKPYLSKFLQVYTRARWTFSGQRTKRLKNSYRSIQSAATTCSDRAIV